MEKDLENFTKEDQFIFLFNMLWTSGDYWERNEENVKPREDALRKLYQRSVENDNTRK